METHNVFVSVKSTTSCHLMNRTSRARNVNDEPSEMRHPVFSSLVWAPQPAELNLLDWGIPLSGKFKAMSSTPRPIVEGPPVSLAKQFAFKSRAGIEAIASIDMVALAGMGRFACFCYNATRTILTDSMGLIERLVLVEVAG